MRAPDGEEKGRAVGIPGVEEEQRWLCGSLAVERQFCPSAVVLATKVPPYLSSGAEKLLRFASSHRGQDVTRSMCATRCCDVTGVLIVG